MIVADTSALVSLATANTLEHVLDEFDVHTTATVVAELEDTAAYDDAHAQGADHVLQQLDGITVHEVDDIGVQSSRIDEGEASCLALEDELDPSFLLTDDLRALPELQTLTDAQVAISPIVLKALVKRTVFTDSEAKERLDRLAETRDWLGAPIYRRAQALFDDRGDH